MIKHIMLIVIALLVLLTMPVIAHQVPPVEVNGLAIELPYVVIAIDTDCLDLKIEQYGMASLAELEKNLIWTDNNLFDSLAHWTLYTTTIQESTGGTVANRGAWLGNIGFDLAK